MRGITRQQWWLIVGIIGILAGCANQVSYVRRDHPIYPTEEIFPQSREAVWSAAKATMEQYPLAVRDEAAGVLETEWMFGTSDVTRQVVRQGDEIQSDFVQIRYRVHLTVSPVGVGTRVAVHQEVFENRPYEKGIRTYYAPDRFVDAESSTEVEHQLLVQIARRLAKH
ncbi:MAG: outer membrane protein assembly factor BamC [Nitrospirota bacterium]|jgi:hypothetical protein